MKTILFVIINVCFLAGCMQVAPKEFIITGDVSNVKDKVVQVYYSYMLNGIPIDDSAVVQSGGYILKGIIDEHVMLQTSASYADTSLHYDYTMNYNVVHITPGTKASVKHGEKFSMATVKGSVAQDEYMQLHDRLVKGETGFLPDYIKGHPNSPLAVFLLNQFIIGPFPDIEQHEPLYNLLSAQNKNTPSGIKLGNRFRAVHTLAPGKPAPALIQKDSSGNTISLLSLKGKYVLIEFWASWCAPCRKENPMLVSMYNTYKNKNFEILGVSMDVSRRRWLNAIREDGLPWINTADMLDTDKNPAAIAYGVSGVPFNVLVDPNGIIIGKDLRGEILERKLGEIFKN